MDSVQVDATVKSQRHSLSRRDTGLYEASSLRRQVVDLDKLNPDTDGNGQVSASELKIYNLLRAQDTDGDGKLTIGELYNGLAALTKVEKNRSMFKKGFFMMSAVSLIQVLLIVGLVTGIVVALKDQFVADNTLTGSSGAILKTAEATEELPLYVAPVLPGKQREALSVMTISYRDPTVHDRMVEAGLIGENDTTLEYPTVEESVQVLSFKKFNDTAADLGVAPGEPGGHRIIRLFNGEATLVTTRADGTSYHASLCAGKVSCAAFTVETGIADLLIEQANGNLTAIGVEVPTGRRLKANVASIHRRLSEEGDCPCADGWVKFEGQWVQPTDAEADEAGFRKSDTADNACGCVTWVKKEEGERRQLFKGECEDAADDAVAALTAELDLPHTKCAELHAAGECDRAIVKKHCPASCGSCPTCRDTAVSAFAALADAAGASYRTCAEAKEANRCGEELAKKHCPATCDACADAELGGCEDAPDELVAKMTGEVFGRAVASCAALRAIREDYGGAGGACDHELAVKYCPVSCGRCDVEAPLDRHGSRGLNDKCISSTTG